MSRETLVSRRGFFSELVKDVFNLMGETEKEDYEESRKQKVLSSFDTLPIAHTYPRELFEDEAKMLGIDIDALGEDEAIKQILLRSMTEGAGSTKKDKEE
jgi:hypothetical protein